MKCLFVAANDHYHGKGGGGTAVRALKARFDDVLGVENVELYCFDEWGRTLPRRVKQVYSIWKSLFSTLPSRSIFVLPTNAQRQLSEKIATAQPDFVVINGGDVWSVIEALPERLPAILIAHNIEHRLMRSHIDQLTGLEAFLRPILSRDVNKLHSLEVAAAKRACNILSISEEDADYFRNLGDNMNVATFLQTFNYQPYTRTERPHNRPLNVGFMAKMTWWPNQEGAAWFVDKVLANLGPSQVVGHFYGAGSEAFDGRLPNLVTHGFVDALDDIWKNCDLMICPILSGSGVNIKFVEALFNRMPVLATTLAARGLPTIEDEHVVYLDQPSEWIDFLLSPKAQELASGSISTRVVDLFRPESQSQHIADFLSSVMTENR
ncbi:MAG: glycosyltransferase [Alphaproteobacteria bacterium]|nr:glycosyltransferase [Alphaproteobacteria bacterium]